MAQVIRQTTFVQSDGKIEIQPTQFPQGAKVEVIVILVLRNMIQLMKKPKIVNNLSIGLHSLTQPTNYK